MCIRDRNIPLPASLSTYLLVIFLSLILLAQKKSIKKSRHSAFKIYEVILCCTALTSFIFMGIGKYPLQKFLLFMYLIVVPILLLDLIFRSQQNLESLNKLKLYLNIVAYISIWWGMTLFVLGYGVSYEGTSRITLVGIDNPIWTSRYLGALVIALYFTAKNRYSPFFLCTVAVAFFIMIQTGTRGTFLALAAAIIISSGKKVISVRTFLVFLGAMMVLALLVFYVGGRLGLGGGDYSVIARTVSYQKAVEYISLQPLLGYGFGNYSIITTGVDERDYPHNLILEFGFEMGMLTCLIFLMYIFSRLKMKRKELDFIYALFVFHFVNSLFSGDIPGNNLLFISGYVLAIYYSFNTTKSKTI